MKPKGTNSPGRFEFFGARSCASCKVMALRMAHGVSGSKHPAARNAKMRIISRHCFGHWLHHEPPRRKYQASTTHEVISNNGVSGLMSVPKPAETPANAANHSSLKCKLTELFSTQKTEPRRRNKRRHKNRMVSVVKNVARVSVSGTAT